MPVPVRLDFTPPDEPDITLLHIEESASSSGPFAELPASPFSAGVYPDYISYITVQATSQADWFRINWENASGVKGPYSNAVQGGTSTLVQQVVTRVMQRDPIADERVVTQVVEWVVAKVMRTGNPYDVTLDPTYDELEGMTLLALARTSVHALITTSSSSGSYTAGLVSERVDSSTKTAATSAIDYLIKEANKLLGLNVTMVMLLEDIDPTGIGTVSAFDLDISRLLLSVE